MSENRYAPEPWRTDSECGFPQDIHDSNNELVAICTEVNFASENSRRIVACVNACAGIPTSRLEAGAADILAYSMELKKQRDELLSDLAEAKRSAEFNFEQYQDVGRLLHEECEKTEKLLAALGVAQATINCAGISTPKIVRDTVEKYAEAISSVKGGV